jgi:alanyl-tRNA synthetase
MDGFGRALEEQRQRSRAGSAISSDIFGGGPIAELKAQGAATEFVGYDFDEAEAEVVGVIRDKRLADSAQAGDEAALVLDRTPFYGEAGGEVGDTGVISGPGFEFTVADTRREEGIVVHVGSVSAGRVEAGATVVARPDVARRADIRRNHTATHLLHWALRQVLGQHAEQAGSLVASDRLRFDFTHMEALADEQLQRIEDLVNDKILRCDPVIAELTSQEDAKARGATALFGEKYGDEVRMLSIGDYSRELCGGLHCRATGEIGLLRILGESSVAAGVRRIEALTGKHAYAHLRERDLTLRAACGQIKTQPRQFIEAVSRLQDQVRSLEKELKQARRRGQGPSAADLLGRAKRVGDTTIVSANLGDASPDDLRAAIEQIRQSCPSAAAVLGGVNDGKPMAIVGLTRDLVQKGLKAGEIVRSIGVVMGGGGGGRPDLAQAGGKDPARLDDALRAGVEAIERSL